MGLLSSAESSANITDNRTAADNASTVYRGINNVESGGLWLNNREGSKSTLNYNDPALSAYAIDAATESAKGALTATSDYFENIIGKVFDLTDQTNERADQAFAANNEIAKLAIAEQVTTDELRLKQYLQIALIGGLGYALIRSGVLNDLVKGFS